jgi:SAM-dependent methyltransferase
MALEIASPARGRRAIATRYTPADLAILSDAEVSRFVQGSDADPGRNLELAWELLYRIEPDLYDRLVRGERIHPGVIDWLPLRVERIVEVGTGSGRLTLELVSRTGALTAVEPAGALRERLIRRLAGRAGVRIVSGFFDALPVEDQAAELVIACSALTASPGHGADAGLDEMERVCAPGGLVVIVWPNHLEWLLGRGYTYRSFAGPMTVEFESLEEAIELAEIFYPDARHEIRRRGDRRVPYDVLGKNPPRDLAFKVMA